MMNTQHPDGIHEGVLIRPYRSHEDDVKSPCNPCKKTADKKGPQLVAERLIPMISAARSLSRIATNALPILDLTRF